MMMGVPVAFGLTNLTDSLPVRSATEQFIVYGPRLVRPPPEPRRGLLDRQTLRLETGALAASCERVKQALLREFGIPDRWRSQSGRSVRSGRIHVLLRPAESPDDAALVAPVYYADGWQYRLEMPQEIEEAKAVRAIVECVLLELANRGAGARSAQVPLWLAEGLSQHLLGTATSDLILRSSRPSARPAPGAVPNGRGWLVSVQPGTLYEGRKPDPLGGVRHLLSQQAPLGFSDLSQPTSRQLRGDAWSLYQGCAHLFVHELIVLRDGRSCLLEMLRRLPEFWNWQTAFLQAFEAHFPSLLEVEKWWAVGLANFTGRNEWQAWPLAEALDRLDEAVHLPAQIAQATNALPARTRVPLQDAIRDWDFARQKPNLQRCLAQLYLVRTRLPAEWVPLADDYRLAVTEYLQQREQAGFDPARKGHSFGSIRLLVRATVSRLEELDRKRAAMAQAAQP